jgi:CubicO group peptidase (beta-lactamase class C family)
LRGPPVIAYLKGSSHDGANAMRRSVAILSLLALAGLLAGCQTRQPVRTEVRSRATPAEDSSIASASVPLSQTRRSALDRLMRDHDRPDAPGCTAAVYRHGDILFAGAFGLANLTTGERLEPQTPMNVGSVAKQFTAAAILLLVRDGRLSLDADIRTFLPELPDYGAPITVRRLLNHTSGMRDYRGLLNLAGHRNSDPVPAARILAMLARQRAPNFPPGEQYQYSNGGYFLAALIVERVAGEPFGAFVRRRIFEPLGMTRARAKGDTTDLPGLAEHYARSGEAGFAPFVEQWDEGDLYMSVEDLARWDRNFHSGELGGTELVRALETRGILTDGRPLNYALGLEHSTLRGHAVIGHGGNTGGSVSTLKRFPEAGLSIAILCNRADGPVEQLADEIAAVVLPPPAIGSADSTEATAATSATLPAATWVGSYHAPGNANVVRVEGEGDGIVLELRGARFPLRSVGANLYQVVGPPNAFARFEPAGAHGPRRVVPVGVDEPAMEAFEPARPTSAELAGFSGDYRCPEIEATIGIRIESGTLVMSLPLEPRVPLEPLEHGVFATENLLLDFDETVAARSPGLRLDQWRARGMRCDRVTGPVSP